MAYNIKTYDNNSKLEGKLNKCSIKYNKINDKNALLDKLKRNRHINIRVVFLIIVITQFIIYFELNIALYSLISIVN